MKELLSIGVNYIIIRHAVLLLSFVKTILIAYFLGPENLGIYALIILIVEYLNYINLGVFDSMNRDVALYLREIKNRDRIKDTISNALGFSALSIIVLFIFFSAYSILLPDTIFQIDLSKYLPVIFCLVLIYQLKQFIVRYLRLYEKYVLLGLLEFLTQLINLVCVILFVEEYQIDAVLYSILGSNIFLVFFGFLYTKNISIRFSLRRIYRLIITGSPILLYAIFLFLFLSIDRAMIGFFYSDIKAMGAYQLALSLASGLFTIFKAASFLFQPKLIRYLNEDINPQDSGLSSVKTQTFYLEMILVILSSIGIILTPIAIGNFLSEFSLSIILTQFLIIAFAIYSISFLAMTYLSSNHLEMKTILPLVFALILSIVLNYTLVYLGYGLYGIAFSKILTFGIYGIFIFRLYLNNLGEPWMKNIVIIFGRLMIFMSLLCFLIYEKYQLYNILILFGVFYSFSLVRISKIAFPLISSYLKRS